MAKEKTTFPLNELLALYMAHNRGQKGTPKAASSRQVQYDGIDLYDNGRLVARHVRKGKTRMVLATQNGQRYGAWGRKSESLPDMLVRLATPKNGPVVKTDSDNWIGANGTVVFTPEVIAEIARNDFNSGIYLARVFRVSLSKLIAEAPGYGYYYGSGEEQFKEREQKAAAIVSYYTPEAKKERARQAKIAAERREHEVREYNRMRPYHDRVNSLNYMLQNARRGTVSASDIFAFYNHVPQEGYRYKLLQDGLQANHGPWPPVGEWTEERTNVRTCNNGWHLSIAAEILRWKSWGPNLYLAEGAGEVGRGDREKQAFGKARLLQFIGRIDDTAMEAIKASKRTMESNWRVIELEAHLTNAIAARDAAEKLAVPYAAS